MYLKSIELYGFKSFAERTKIEFNDVITCIVGPNGSGKSNITDAIKWVLGEQSSINLRGSKMQDVIFLGTNKRRSLGMCEVIINFDNSTNFLDLDYSEVSVKRKLYKNGDSEYYINNSPCRLKDIRDLFMDTGIGRDGYSIIGQGKIDAILNSKPTERRAIFEEASGISRYKSQKHEIERKLKNTKDNITRLSDLLIEIESQKNSLKEESVKAKKYLDIYYEILDNELKTLYNDLIDLNNNSLVLNNQKNEYIEEKSKYKNILIDLEEEYKKLKMDHEELENEVNELQISNIENIRHEKDLSNKINLQKEQIKNNESKIDQLEGQYTYINEEVNRIFKDQDNSNIRLTELIEEKNIILEAIKELNKKILSLEEELNKSLSENDKKALEIKNIEELISKKTIDVNTIKSLNLNRQENIRLLEESTEDLKSKISTLTSSLDDLNKDYLNLQEEINKKQTLLEKKSSILVNNRTEYSNLNEDLQNLKNEINNQKLRISTLENMEENYEGYNKSVRDFFRFKKRNKLEFKGLHDTVANLIRVEDRYEKAITTALGGNSQNLIIDTFDGAKEIISLLKKENLGRITFFPMDDLRYNPKKIEVNDSGFVDLAINLIDFDPKFKDVMEYILGNIIVSKDLDSAKRISIKNKYNKIVTLDGDILNPGGSLTGGSIKTSGSIFNRKNELEKLKDNVTNNDIKLNNTNAKLEKLKEVIALNTLEVENFSSQIIKLKDDSLVLEKKKMELDYSLDNSKNTYTNKTSQIEELTKGLNTNLVLLDEYDLELEKLLKDKDFIINNEGSNKVLVNSIRQEIENHHRFVNEKNLKLANINSEVSFVERELEKFKSSIHRGQDEMKGIKINIQELDDDTTNLANSVDTLENDLSKIININSTFSDKHKNLLDKKKRISISLNNTSDLINDRKNTLLDIEKNTYYLEQKLENYFEKERSIIEYVGDNYKFTFIDLTNQEQIKDKILSKSKIKKLKENLSSLGNVNVGAIKSYKDVVERYEFTLEQFNDLTKTENTLEDLIKDIEITIEEKFNESFKIINENFNRIFKYMFNGGMAELVLEETEDNEPGVDIIAQLPGKKRQLLNAMSGGERSMTTVALLFALLETKASPFCLLDEVDAALDESNIKRFLSYLKNLKNIQFAIVTHRKSTMAVANNIYGITMEEPGVSKVISLSFEKGDVNNVQVV